MSNKFAIIEDLRGLSHNVVLVVRSLQLDAYFADNLHFLLKERLAFVVVLVLKHLLC